MWEGLTGGCWWLLLDAAWLESIWRAPGHGKGAKGHVTNWHHKWFDLVFTLSSHLIFSSFVWWSLIVGMWALSVCVGAWVESMTVAVLTAMLISAPPWLLISFQHVCHCWCSHGLLIICWQVLAILNRCSCSVWKQCCYTSNPPGSPLFLKKAQKQVVPLICFGRKLFIDNQASQYHFSPLALFPLFLLPLSCHPSSPPNLPLSYSFCISLFVFVPLSLSLFNPPPVWLSHCLSQARVPVNMDAEAVP